jgi:CHAT domain-containing protein
LAGRSKDGAEKLASAQAARLRLAAMTEAGKGTSKQVVELALQRDKEDFKALLDYCQQNSIRVPTLTVALLAAALPADEAAVAYRYVNWWTVGRGKPPAAEERLFAFVIKGKGKKLVAMDLGAAAALNPTIEAWRQEILPTDQREGGRTARGKPPASVRPELQQRLVDPVLAVAAGAKALHVCLDGPLHLIPIEELQGRKGISFRFEESLLRLLTADPAPAKEAPSLLVLGGLEYVLEKPLKDSGREADDVARQFAKKFPKAGKPVQLTGAAANREALFANLQGVRYLHFATHGYFLSGTFGNDGVENVEVWEQAVREMAPMTLCGLVLSGDVKVTAEELAGVDLGQCALAVLSACATYLGQPRRGHGPASLQAALHEAGVRTVITSRWKVPDETTAELMRRFYGFLWQGKGKAEALELAKAAIKKDHQDLRDWAAWILTGDPK